jgi:hypothetical protein
MQVMTWLRTHKARVGWVAAFVAGGLQGVGQVEAAGVVALLAAALLGAGALPSDTEERTRR